MLQTAIEAEVTEFILCALRSARRPKCRRHKSRQKQTDKSRHPIYVGTQMQTPYSCWQSG